MREARMAPMAIGAWVGSADGHGSGLAPAEGRSCEGRAGDADGRWGCEEVCHGREGCSSLRGGSYRSRVGWSSSCWSGGCDIGQWMRERGRGSRDTGALGWYSMHVYVEVPVADRRGHGAAADVRAGDAGGKACGLWAGKVNRGWVCDGFRADGRMRATGGHREGGGPRTGGVGQAVHVGRGVCV